MGTICILIIHSVITFIKESRSPPDAPGCDSGGDLCHGTVVGTTNSESGGTFVFTYTIPDGLKGQSRIAIRMDATSGGYYSYNWFWNTTYL